MEQRSQEWFSARCGRFTGSRFAALMAGEETQTFKDLLKDVAWERLTGQTDEGFTSAAMQHGIDTEAEARDWYSFECGVVVREFGFIVHPTIDCVGISPDGLVDPSGLVEIKCPQPRAHIETMVKRKLPSKYRWQVQGQLWVTGREWLDFVSYHPATGGVIVRVEPDPKDAEALAERAALADELVNKWVKEARST